MNHRSCLFLELGTGREMAKNIYTKFPDSYSILTSFAYSYFEELIHPIAEMLEYAFFNHCRLYHHIGKISDK